MARQEAELVLKVNNTAYYGDLYQLKSFVRAGADPKNTDYDGRSPLHLAASKGHEDIVQFLIQEGVNVNALDNLGTTPLLEAVKNGHDKVADLLRNEGATLDIKDVGCVLCAAVANGDIEFLKRLLSNGVNPNSKDYDHRTPLHVASSQGLYLLAKMLVEAGANVFLKDRWGNTPLDEARMGGNKNLIKLLEDAKNAEMSGSSRGNMDIIDKMHPKKCTVFPYDPWTPKYERLPGVVLWVPRSVQELITTAAEQMGISDDSYILSEDGGKILDVDMIDDGQKLYIMSKTE